MSDNPFRLDGKYALITGGATGIGYGVANAFIHAGAKVLIVSRREEVLKKACKSLGANASYITFDINQQHEVPGFINSIEAEFGPIEILVNNAGSHHKDFVVDTSDEDFLAIIQTNLLSVFTLTRECVKYMIKRNRGSIILMSSMTAGVAMDKVVGYSTAKTALLGMMRTLTVELMKSNIRINAIAPGWIESDMLKAALDGDPKRKLKILGRIPSGKFGQPSDIGNLAVFLASDASSYVCNAFIPVDGGAFQSL
jgi:gluconate 5-dehydrogenase